MGIGPFYCYSFIVRNERTFSYDASQRPPEEVDSIEHCRNSDYKYFIHYVAGETYIFKQFINEDNAVR